MINYCLSKSEKKIKFGNRMLIFIIINISQPGKILYSLNLVTLMNRFVKDKAISKQLRSK